MFALLVDSARKELVFLEAALLVHITLILEVNLNKPVSFAILVCTVLDLTRRLLPENVMPEYYCPTGSYVSKQEETGPGYYTEAGAYEET